MVSSVPVQTVRALILSALWAACTLTAPSVFAAGEDTTAGIFLPNQWTLRPAGETRPLGDFPCSLAVSPDGRHAAILHAGYGDHEVRIFDLSTRRETGKTKLQNAWFGATFTPDGRELLVSGGADDVLRRYGFRDGTLSAMTTVSLGAPRKVDKKTAPWYPAGVAISADGRTAFAAVQYRGVLVAVDLASSPSRHRIVTEFTQPNASPYRVILHPSRPLAYVSLWGAKAVAEVTLESGRIRLIPTDSHPNEMAISRDGLRLFVACANTNLVDVVDTRLRRVEERLDSALYPGVPPGSTPNAVALSRDQKTLLVANADNNNLAVFDVSQRGAARPRGHIPTGWYPTGAAFAPTGDIVVVNGKGDGSMANPGGPNPTTSTRSQQYIGGLLRGSISFITKPDDAALARHTAEALRCSPLRADLMPVAADPGNPIPSRVGDPSPIRYCVYIIKENRTYDQVLGDMPEGNGDASLCLFPQRVTPNHHGLAREFVLLDHFFVESEVSADGHEWTTGAYATDFVEKTWPPNYGGHGKHPYPAEGNHPMGNPDAGHLWDAAKRAGISYRSYGEFVNGGGPKCDGTTNDRALKGHFDPCYAGYDLDISDLDRAKQFLSELKRFEQGGDLPRLIVMRLPNDHTWGTQKGKLTPRSYVAQNDLALGMVIEGLSKSPFWKEMAVFVVEDDAQNGPDHVDAHRTVAFLAGPYVKRGAVIHQMYSTASMLRTMELILGLPPMTQFDAAARPMFACFTAKPDYAPYLCKAATHPLDEKNPDKAPMQKEVARMDFSKEDAAPDALLNQVVWKSVHGADSVMPAPIRAAYVHPHKDTDGDGD